jgi:hypothetical protein
MYYKRDIQARSRNHCFRGKAISITYPECVFVALVCNVCSTQSACAILYCHLWPVWLYHIFSTLSHKRHVFRKKVIEHKMYVLIFSTNFVWNISHSKKNSVRYYHKCTQVFMWSTRYSCQILMKLESSWQIFEKYSSTKFHENPSNGNRVIPCGQRDRQTWSW